MIDNGNNNNTGLVTVCYVHTASPLKKGEKGEIWTWAIYKVQLPVTCGDHEGALNRGRLAKGKSEGNVDANIGTRNLLFSPLQHL